MKRFALWVISLSVSMSSLSAQDRKDAGHDVPTVKKDPAQTVFQPYVSYPSISAGKLPDFLILPEETVETKEERALRINKYVFEHTMASVTNFLEGRPIIVNRDIWMIQHGQRSTMFYFISPFSIPFGYVPLMNSSNPFVTALIPGWAPDPDADKYRPDRIPQEIGLEYDFSTGTYKQVTNRKYVDGKVTFGDSGNSSTQPVPDIPVTPVQRMMRGLE